MSRKMLGGCCHPWVWRMLLALLFVASGIAGFANNAQALSVRVSQESSAGAGDFDANVLGSINPFSTGLTTAGFYQYGNPNFASYNGNLNGGPNPVSDLSQIFLLDASDGLSLVVVHDNPSDGTGGLTQTRWNLSGDTAAQVLADDPGEPVTVSAGGTQFDSTKTWAACCTDGYALGSLDATWVLIGQFLSAPTGIANWAAVSSDFSTTGLTLTPGRRVRLDVVVPLPAALPLFGGALALLGLVGWRRKRMIAL